MGSSLQEQIGVASGALHWDVGGFRLWQSSVPGVVLYVARELRLARESDRRYHAAVTQTRRWTKGSYEVTGGSALLGVFGDEDPLAFENEWVRVLLNKGYKEAPRPKFLPLPVRDVSVAATPGAGDGRPLPPPAGQTPSATLLFELTAGGAQAWPRAVLDKTTVSGSVRLSYTYPQMMPGASARVQVHGARVYTSLAATLHKAADGTLYGSFAAIGSAWNALVRDGAVTIALAGPGSAGGTAPADVGERLSEQAREKLFDVLFVGYQPPNPPAAGSGGSGDGTLYALRWRSPADAIDPGLTITVEGWTWLSASLEADLSALLGALDESYLHTTYAYASVPVTVAVAPFKAVSNVALSLDFGNVRAPEAPLFDAQGGTRQFLVTTERPETVQVAYRAKVAFKAATWPVVEIADSAALGPDGYAIVLKPEAWVRRHTLYMYVRAGNQIVHAPEDNPADYLAVTANYTAPYLPAPIRDAARITPAGPVELSYPVPPGSTPGRATLNVVGMVGGQMVSASQLALDENEDAVYLLVAGNKVQLVGKHAVTDESDALVGRLRAARARPLVVDGAGAADEEERDLDVSVDVSLIPQPTEVSCWAAALAMVVSARDFASTSPETVAEAAGMDVDTGYGWGDIQRAVATWNLVEEGPRSAMPGEWARLLEAWGPIWVVEVGAPYHAVVLAGVQGDGTPDGTWVTVVNPWPPGVGVVETKTFLDFDQEFGLGADAGAAMVHAVGE
jgi:hypothetical protein